MDWRLLARSVLRYTVLAAGGTITVVLALADGVMPMFVRFIGGLVLVTVTLSASNVRRPDPSEHHRGGSVDFDAHPGEHPNKRRYLAIDRIGALYGLGLALFGGAAFSMGGSLPL